MNIYKIILILSFVLFTQNTFAQTETETLEKLHRMVMNDRANDARAKEAVWNYHNSTKEKIREKRGKLTQEQYDNLNRYERMRWTKLTNAIRDFYRGDYSKYYRDNVKYLESYKDDVLDKLYEYIYN